MIIHCAGELQIIQSWKFIYLEGLLKSKAKKTAMSECRHRREGNMLRGYYV